MMTSDNAEHRTCSGEAGLRPTARLMADSLPRVQIRVTGRLRVTPHTATGLLALGLLLHTPTAAAAVNPSWRILALVYQTTDFSYRDAQGVDQRVVGGLSAQDLARADDILRHFVEVDVPRLSSGNQFPSLTVRIRPVLSRLTRVGQFSWYPAPTDLGTDRDPTFDTIIVIWQTIGIDQLSGRRAELSPEFGGLASYVPQQQTFVSASVFGADLFGFGRNLLKHEWGHNILQHYAWTGAAPKPAVDNHIDNTNNRYVNCVTGASYILVDETDAAPIPNSIYNNDSGFTHDYFSGTTATADNPQRCLGITAAAWATGGPVTKPRGGHGDFDGNRKSDILWRQDTGTLAMWLMDGATIVTGAVVANVGTNWTIVGQDDFDGDGRHDLLWRESGGTAGMWFMNGSTVSSGVSLGNIPTAWSVAGTGDFDGNRKADIFWRDNVGNVVIWLMNGSTIAQTTGYGAIPLEWSIAGTGDFNGNGETDVLWRNSTTGDLAIWFMNGTALTSAVLVANVATSWSPVAVNDLNGDGKADIVWRHSDGTVAIWLMDGAQPGLTTSFGVVSTDWVVAKTGDFDSDTRADILWRNTSNGAVAIWFMDGITLTSSVVLGSVGADWAIQGM